MKLLAKIFMMSVSLLIVFSCNVAGIDQDVTLLDTSEVASRGTTVNVSTYNEFKDAINNASPGDTIVLAAGITISGGFKILDGVDGEPGNRITIKSASSTNKATIKGSGGGTALSIKGHYWTLQDLKITYAQKGVVFDNANYGEVINCEVYGTQMEAIHFRDGSDNGLVDNCHIYDTGTTRPEYGEGVYVGTDKGSWDKYSEDVYNTVIKNTTFGPNVRAEHVDIKEGTLGTIVEYCTFDGTGISGENSADTFINDKGKDAIIRHNVGNKNGNDTIRAFGDISNRGTYNSGEGGWWYGNTFNGASSSDYFIAHAQGTYTYFYGDNIKNPSGGNMYISGGTYKAGDAGDGGDSGEEEEDTFVNPVSNVSATSDETSVRVTWDNPSDTDFDRVEITLGSTTKTRTTEAVIFDGLESGTSYTFELVAFDITGNSSTVKTITKSTTVVDTGGETETSNLKIQYDCNKPSTSEKSIQADLLIINTGSSDESLSNYTIRYWFTNDGLTPTYSTRYAAIGSSYVSGSFGSDYLEISFTGGVVKANDDTKLKISINNTTYKLYDQSNDYSFDGSISSFIDYDKITIYKNGSLVWGVEP